MPVHDSFLWQTSMPSHSPTREGSAHVYGLHKALKVLRRGHPATHLYHLKVTTFDLGKQGRRTGRRSNSPGGKHRDDVPL